MEMMFRVRAAEVSRDQHPSDTIDFTLCPSRRRHRPPPSGDGALCPRVDLAPTLPADRAHNRSALVRREERRADFTSLDAMGKILVGDVGLRFLRLGREGIGACGRQGDAGCGAREILKQIAPRSCCRTEADFHHLEVLLATIPQAECRRPSDEEWPPAVSRTTSDRASSATSPRSTQPSACQRQSRPTRRGGKA
jgi:hypothetical protein